VKVTRRGFLQVAGLTAGAAAGCSRAPRDRAAESLERWAAPEERWTATVCPQCPAGCGLLVRTADGVPVGVRGNPAHPVNRGALCPKAFGLLQAVGSPDRLRGPAVRDGARGSGRFRPIGWDEALDLVAGRLGELRGRGQAHTVAVLGGQYRGHRDTIWQRFTRAYGTPNYVRVRCLAPERPALAHRLMHGVASPLAWDLERANLVVTFGVGLLESWLGPVAAGRALAAWRAGPERPRGVLVAVDPRRSLTAAVADRWVRVRPGTDGILALGLAHVLLREGLHDREFVTAHTTGFEDWTDAAGRRHAGFRTVVLERYGLQAVSQATGVPVETITAVARDLGRIRPAVVLGERGPAFGPGDLETRLAIHALNALVGAVGTEGGLVMPGELPLATLPDVALDPVAARGAREARIDGAGEGAHRWTPDAPQALAARLEAGRPYPVNALMLFATNPVASLPGGAELARALARVPFVVSFSPYADESSRLADLVLPDCLGPERWQDDPVTHLAGFTAWTVGRPAARPPVDARSTGDLVLQLARRLSGPVGESLPWESYEDLLRDAARGLHEAERGFVVGTREEEWVRRIQERQGYWSPEFESYDDFWDALVTRGAWWDPGAGRPSRRAAIGHPSGRLALFVPGPRGEPLARPEPPAPAAGGDERFPLLLVTYRLATRPVGGGQDQPWLMESPAAHVDSAWRSWVDVHPADARALGIHGGDAVWVESARGRVRVTAQVAEGGLPGTVHMPLHGVGEANPNALVPDTPDPTRGLGVVGPTRVRIGRA
jgi:anaerobic selenocysteine-containing dehydrogenase